MVEQASVSSFKYTQSMYKRHTVYALMLWSVLKVILDYCVMYL